MVNIKHFLVLCPETWGFIFSNLTCAYFSMGWCPPPPLIVFHHQKWAKFPRQISVLDEEFMNEVFRPSVFWCPKCWMFFFYANFFLEVNLGNVKLSEDPFLAASFQSKHPPALPIHQEVWDPGCMTWCIDTLVSRTNVNYVFHCHELCFFWQKDGGFLYGDGSFVAETLCVLC